MKITLVRCFICLGWFSPVIRNHCPYCGAFQLLNKFYALSNTGYPRVIASAVHVPAVLRSLYYR